MTLKQRRDALKERYGWRIKQHSWTKAKGTDRNPTPEKFMKWLEAIFPDRREVGLVLSDLGHLEPTAYKKIFNWSRPNSGVSKDTIESFGVPSKATKYDPVRDAEAPSSIAEVYARAERGEDSFMNLHRAYGRARHHTPRT